MAHGSLRYQQCGPLSKKFVDSRFKTMPLNDFWTKYVRVYRNIGNVAMRILQTLSATYICENGFFAFVSVETKARNKLDCETDMHCLQLGQELNC